MRTEHPKYAALGNEGLPGFDWSKYDDGWNGVSLKVNSKVRVKKGSKDKVFSHEPYAQQEYNRLSGIEVENVKDVTKGTTVSVNDMHLVDDNTLSVTVGGGANNVLVDMTKENSFFRILEYDGQKMDRHTFAEAMKTDPSFKEKVLSTHLYVKFGTDKEKGSIWDGHLDMLNKELKEQITANSKAYIAEIIGTNGGGFVVEVMGTLKAFMPGSMAASNRITDYESYVGRKMEVMVESWSPKYGFVVSRKKFLNKMRPYKVQPIVDELHKNPNKIYTGRVTGATNFGVFIELDEYITGMLHKTLASDAMRQRIREFETVEPGEELQVYVHAVEGTRVIFSDVPTAERDAVIAKREAEEAQLMKELGLTPANSDASKSGYAGYHPRQTVTQQKQERQPQQKTVRKDDSKPNGKQKSQKQASESDLQRLQAHFNKEG